MCGLDDQLLHAVCRRALQRLLNIVDLFAVPGQYVVKDDLSGKCSSHRPVGIGLLQSLLDSADIRRAAVIEGCSETHDQQFFLSDVVAIKRIILRCIACICAKIVRIREFSLNKRFLLVRKGVPGRLGFLAHLISLFGPLLHIDRVDLIGSCFCRLQVLFAGRLCGCSGICSVLSLLTVRSRVPGRSLRRVSRHHFIERNRVRYDDLVVIPFPFGPDERHIKFLVQIRHGYIKSVHFLACAVAVNHFFGKRLKELSAFLLRVLSRTAEKIHSILGRHHDMDRHLAAAHDEDALAVFGLIYMKHRAVRIEIRLIHTVRDGRAVLSCCTFLTALAGLSGLSCLCLRCHAGISCCRSSRRAGSTAGRGRCDQRQCH